MPDPNNPDAPLPPPQPGTQRQWRLPQGEERADRGASNLGEYMFGVGTPWLRNILTGDISQLGYDLADPNVRNEFAHTGKWVGAYANDDTGPARQVEEAVKDPDWYDPSAHPEWHDAGYNPLERFGDFLQRRLYQRDTYKSAERAQPQQSAPAEAEAPPRQGVTTVQHEGQGVEEEEPPIEWQGTVGVTR